MSIFRTFSLIILTSLVSIYSSQAQYKTQGNNVEKANLDTLRISVRALKPNRSFPIQSFLVLTALIAYGLTSLENDGLKNFNTEIKEEIYTEHPHKKMPVDNYLQFAPAAMVYGLNAVGIKGQHNLRDRTMIYFMSNIILSGTLYSMKTITAVQRPDGSAYTSFPSGHTAEAFASAEFLRQEYKDVSSWYGIAGYAMAATTGYLRMYNNKHWLSDVVAGAGVGIASTRLAYWLYPKISHKFFKDKEAKTFIMPSYQNKTVSIGMIHKF